MSRLRWWYMPIMKLVWIPFCGVLAACGSSASHRYNTYAVGTYLGGGSMFGSDPCTYDGPPTVIELAENKGMGKLVGEGTVVQTCPDNRKTTYTIKRPTVAKISGADSIKAGASEIFSATLFAGSDELGGKGDPAPEWKLGADCATSVEEVPDSSAQDTGGKSGTLQLRHKAKGTCAVSVTRMGLAASKTITVE